WAAASGLFMGLAILFHVENVLFALPALLLMRRSAVPALAVCALVVGGAYALVLPAHGAAWLSGASHGLHYPLRPTTPAIAFYGACKALVYSPYPYEASWTRVLGQFAVGALVLAWLLWARRGARLPLPRAVVLAWLVPYALVGCAFYASDAERWTFLLPLAWLAASARPRRALAVAAALVVATAGVWLPTARDATLRTRAQAPARLLQPGHGSDG